MWLVYLMTWFADCEFVRWLTGSLSDGLTFCTKEFSRVDILICHLSDDCAFICFLVVVGQCLFRSAALTSASVGLHRKEQQYRGVALKLL